MKTALLTLMLASCGGAGPSTPEAVTEAVSDPPVEILPVERLGDEMFVVLGSGEAPSGEGRTVLGEDTEFDFTMHPSDANAPTLTLVGPTGSCEPSSASRATLARHFETPEDEQDWGAEAYDIVAIEGPCDPLFALRGPVDDAQFAALEFTDPPFGEPIVGTGEGWVVRLEYGPSEDGICPGLPCHVQVKRGTEPLLRRNTYLMPSNVHVLTAGERAWLVLDAGTDGEVFELTGERAQSTWSKRSSIDSSGVCD